VTGSSISHHPTLGGTEKMRSWPNLPYAVLDEHSAEAVTKTSNNAHVQRRLKLLDLLHLQNASLSHQLASTVGSASSLSGTFGLAFRRMAVAVDVQCIT